MGGHNKVGMTTDNHFYKTYRSLYAHREKQFNIYTLTKICDARI